MPHLDDKLNIPAISDRLITAVGSFMFAWGIIERELDTAFPVLFHTDPTLASCLYANLGTKAKIDMLLSAVDMVSIQLGERLTASAQSTLGQISALSDKARTTLAHGQPMFFGEVAKASRWEIARHIARASHKIVIHPRNSRYWAAQAKIALRLAQRWRTCVAKVHGKMGHLTLDDLETICRTRIQESLPAPARRHRRLPLKKHVFAGLSATVAKWPRT